MPLRKQRQLLYHCMPITIKYTLGWRDDNIMTPSRVKVISYCLSFYLFLKLYNADSEKNPNPSESYFMWLKLCSANRFFLEPVRKNLFKKFRTCLERKHIIRAWKYHSTGEIVKTLNLALPKLSLTQFIHTTFFFFSPFFHKGQKTKQNNVHSLNCLELKQRTFGEACVKERRWTVSEHE